MSLRLQKLDNITQKIHFLKAREEEATGFEKKKIWLHRWAWMIAHEYIRDDVRMRAESLSFLMIFSLLPLIAGGFFIFTVFAQFGMVQDALVSGVNQFLSTIPLEHREFVQDYILKFKDAYLASINKSSGSVGIFALLFLLWIGLQTFNNVDRTLNQIWFSDRVRPFVEQVRNFLVVSIVAPLGIIAALSIPLILRKTFSNQGFSFHWLETLLNQGLIPLIVFSIFVLVYRYVPVRGVRWKSAAWGAAFSAVLLQLCNAGMRLYFRVGTTTAYGKAAVVPLIAIWIYLVWLVVILGAEVSYLIQHEQDLWARGRRNPSLREGEGLLKVLSLLQKKHDGEGGGVSEDYLLKETRLVSEELKHLLKYLGEKGWIVFVEKETEGDDFYVLSRSTHHLDIPTLLRDYYAPGWSVEGNEAEANPWVQKLEGWVNSFQNMRLT